MASEAVFYQLFYDFPPDRVHEALRNLNTSLLPRRTFEQVIAEHLELIPADMDVE